MINLSDEKKDEVIEALSQNTYDSIYIKDLDGKFEWVNEAKATNSNRRPEEMIGLTDFDLMPEEEAKKAWEYDRKAIESCMCVKGEENLTRPDGSVKWVSFTKCPKIRNGKVVGVMGISRDITEQKMMEEKKLKAENHNVAVTNLLKHDLINRLMAMTLNVTLISKNKYTNLDIAFNNLKKKILGAEKIIKDCVLMDDQMSRVQMIDLSDLVDSVLDEYDADFDENNIVIDNNLGGIPQDIIRIKASELWISLIKTGLRNCIENSLKHAGKDIIIAVGCENMERAVKIIYYNNGNPIPKENVDKLFDPGFTGGKGTGMGLYLTRESVRNLGGDIWYEPSWEGHTQFIMLIPK